MIGDVIAYYRKANKLTQEELGQLLGVTNQTVSKWESGVSLPDVMIIPGIADTLHISLDTLYGRDKDKSEMVKADDFPDYCFVKLVEEFFNQSGARVVISAEDKTDVNSYFKALSSGWNLGCISDIAGAIVISDDLAFIDRTFKKKRIEETLNSRTLASVFQILGDKTCLKVFSYQYKKYTLAETKNFGFTLVEISQKCGITEDEAYGALEKLESLKLEVKEFEDKLAPVYYFVKPKAVYLFAMLKLVDMMVSDDHWHVIRDTSFIRDYWFEKQWKQ